METLYITAILGLVWAGAGLAFILNPGAVLKGLNDFLKSKGLITLGGMLSLIVGAVIMVFHFSWVTPWVSLITVIGIVSFIKGIWYLAFPDSVVGLKKGLMKNEGQVRGWGILMLLIGIAFLYLSVF